MIKSGLNILVIGDLMIDHYINGTCHRISPEAPVPVVEIIRETYTLGGAGNVLQNLKALGCNADIVAVMGDDDNAAIVIDQLSETGMNGKHIVKDPDRCTTVKSRVMVTSHQLIRLDRENTHPISNTIENHLLDLVTADVANYDIVLISDYDKGLLTPSLLAKLISICKKAGKLIIADPKGTDFTKYKGVNIIKPNKKEATIASGINISDSDSLKAACVKIKDITACDSIVVTMSEDGIATYTDGGLEIVPTKAIDVIDVTGAGDTVLAAIGIALASGSTLAEACNFANHAAAIVVSKVGSATATLHEVEKSFKIN